MRVRSRRRRKTVRVSRADRRRRILAAASRVFLRRGYARALVRDVAREAGVARGTFYAHFDSKRHVLEVLARTWLSSFLPPEARPPVADRRALEAALAAVHGAALAAFAGNPEAVRVLYGDEAARGPGLGRALAEHEREWVRRIAAPVVLAQAAGVVDGAADVARTSECVLGMLTHVARRLVPGDDADVAAWTRAVVRVHLAALA